MSEIVKFQLDSPVRVYNSPNTSSNANGSGEMMAATVNLPPSAAEVSSQNSPGVIARLQRGRPPEAPATPAAMPDEKPHPLKYKIPKVESESTEPSPEV